jgi:hypothetical protein
MTPIERLCVPSFVLLLALLSACDIENNLNGAKDADNAGDVPEGNCTDGLDNDGDGLKDADDPDCGGTVEPEPPDDDIFEPPCYLMESEGIDPYLTYGNAIPGLGWTVNSCHAMDSGLTISGSYAVQSFSIKGSGASAFPGTYPVRLVQGLWISGSPGYPSEDNLASADDVAVGGSGYWTADFDASETGSIQAGSGTNWKPIVNIQDTARADADSCLDYQTVHFCPVLVDTTARRMIPPNSTCAAGSGTFKLLPRRLIDHDEDGSMAVVFDPIMMSGTGEMTGAAWIRSARMVSGGGLGMRVLKTNRPFVVDALDQLTDAAVISRAVTGTTTTFLSGVISGVPPFFMPDTSGTQPMNPKVELAWDCSMPLPADEFNAALGFSFDLGDLGCGSQWTQRFTARPVPTLAPDKLVLEPYGAAANHRTLALEPAVGGGYKFNQIVGGLLMKGRVNSFDANQGMSVTIDKVQYAGASMCTPGTYLLQPED